MVGSFIDCPPVGGSWWRGLRGATTFFIDVSAPLLSLVFTKFCAIGQGAHRYDQRMARLHGSLRFLLPSALSKAKTDQLCVERTRPPVQKSTARGDFNIDAMAKYPGLTNLARCRPGPPGGACERRVLSTGLHSHGEETSFRSGAWLESTRETVNNSLLLGFLYETAECLRCGSQRVERGNDLLQ